MHTGMFLKQGLIFCLFLACSISGTFVKGLRDIWEERSKQPEAPSPRSTRPKPLSPRFKRSSVPFDMEEHQEELSKAVTKRRESMQE